MTDPVRAAVRYGLFGVGAFVVAAGGSYGLLFALDNVTLRVAEPLSMTLLLVLAFLVFVAGLLLDDEHAT